jgi:hypothetical protein
MNIHLPAILMFTRGTRFWHTAIYHLVSLGVYLSRIPTVQQKQQVPHWLALSESRCKRKTLQRGSPMKFTSWSWTWSDQLTNSQVYTTVGRGFKEDLPLLGMITIQYWHVSSGLNLGFCQNGDVYTYNPGASIARLDFIFPRFLIDIVETLYRNPEIEHLKFHHLSLCRLDHWGQQIRVLQSAKRAQQTANKSKIRKGSLWIGIAWVEDFVRAYALKFERVFGIVSQRCGNLNDPKLKYQMKEPTTNVCWVPRDLKMIHSHIRWFLHLSLCNNSNYSYYCYSV